jgi:arginyl-tRNA synthetase
LGPRACNVAFQLTKLRKNSPRTIAPQIVAGLDRGALRLVRDVQVAGPGFINFYRDEQAYARLVLDAVCAVGDTYGRRDGGPVRRSAASRVVGGAML